MTAMKISRDQAANVAAFIFSITLVGLAISAISLAGNADNILKAYYPAGVFTWNTPDYRNGHPEVYFDVALAYDPSSEIKTFISAAVSLLAGLLGIYAFGFSPKRPSNKPWLLRFLLLAATTACIASITCVSWAAVAEVHIKRSTCWFNDRVVPNHTYMCSVENAACNFLRFTEEGYEGPMDDACLGFRHARFMMIPLAVVSLVLVGLYSAMGWMGRARETEEERAEVRVGRLREE